MLTSKDRILATHTGSLPRARELTALLVKREAGESYDEAALKQEIKGYTFYLSIAARAKTELASRLFEYLAFIKSQQIDQIRKVCTTF